MDINVALAIVRREVRAYYGGQVVDMSALVDAAASIDVWLSRGGFLPMAWATEAQTRNQPRSRDNQTRSLR